MSVAGSAEEAKWNVEGCGADGAGFIWEVKDKEEEARWSVAPPPKQKMQWELQTKAEMDVASGQAGAKQANQAADDDDDDEDDEEEWDPDLHFKREVAETFLRCVKLRFDQANVTIEINALKLAENKSFADCANYICTAIMGMCLPAPPGGNSEYASLYAAQEPDLSTNQGDALAAISCGCFLLLLLLLLLHL